MKTKLHYLLLFFTFLSVYQISAQDSFESGFDGWTNATGDNFDWTRDSGGTPSQNTGPTSGASGNFYLYLEATNRFFGQRIWLDKVFSFVNRENAQITFNYHMRGAAMGTLNLLVSKDNGETFTNVFTISGNQGSNWLLSTVDLSAFNNETVILRFEGIRGNDFTSDIAIDNLNVTFTEKPIDNDGDGVLDKNDSDDDNDGILDTLEGCSPTNNINIGGTIGYTTNISNSNDGTYTASGTEITYDFTESGTSIQTINLSGAGQHGPIFKFSGNSGNSGSIDMRFSSYVVGGKFKLTDFDEEEVLTVNVYDQFGNIIDIESGGFATLGQNVDMNRNVFSENGTVAESSGDNISDDSIGAVVFDFAGVIISRINVSIFHPRGSSIRFTQFNSFCSRDTDGDNIPDVLDSDSDGDGCSDADEAYFGSVTNADADDNGFYGTGTPTVNSQGRVNGASYGTPNAYYLNASINTCKDTDNDGVPDDVDLDDDNDGILDTIEENCTSATKGFVDWVSDFGSATTGTDISNNLPLVSSLIDGQRLTVSFQDNPSNPGLEFMDVSNAFGLGNVFQIANAQGEPGGGVTTFSFTNEVNNLTFTMQDIDARGTDFKDKIVIQAKKLDGSIVSISEATNVFFSGAAVSYLGNNTFIGTGDVTNSNPGDGVLSLTFPETITEISFQYFNDLTSPNTRQRIGIANLQYTLVCDTDIDKDGIPNTLDLDSDNDGCFDAIEGADNLLATAVDADGRLTGTVNAQGIPNNVNQTNGQQIGNSLDQSARDTNGQCDIDNDGVIDSADKCNGFDDTLDNDSDGIPDGCDLDDDNDGITDVNEGAEAKVWDVDGTNLTLTSGGQTSTLSFTTTSAFTPAPINSVDFFNIDEDLATGVTDTYTITSTLPLREVNFQLLGLGNKGSLVNASVGNFIITLADGTVVNDADFKVMFGRFPNSPFNIGPPVTEGVLKKVTIGGKKYVQDGTNNGSGRQATGFLQFPNEEALNKGIVSIKFDFFGSGVHPLGIQLQSKIRKDTDNDGILDDRDLDSDGDGCFDAIEGADNLLLTGIDGTGKLNGTPNTITGIPADVNTTTGQQVGASNDASLKDSFEQCDSDGDGTIDANDKCPGFNDFADNDGDSIPDECDLDDDNDGILDSEECAAVPPPFTFNLDVNNLTFTDSGTAGDIGDTALYSSVGTYKGKTVDLKLTVTANSDPANMIVNINGFTAGTDLYPIHLEGTNSQAIPYASCKIEFFENGTNTKIQVPAAMAFRDIDLLDPAPGESIEFEKDRVQEYYLSSNPATNMIVDPNRTVSYDGTVGRYVRVTSSATDAGLANESLWFGVRLLDTDSFSINVLKRNFNTGYVFGSVNFTNTPDTFKLNSACLLDTDEDGIPNAFDTDSDADGCPDALEGAGSFQSASLVNAGTDDSLGDVVETDKSSPNYGVPILNGTSTKQSTTTAVVDKNVKDACLVDLSVLKTIDKPIKKVGEKVVFTITLKNEGDSDATNVQVKDMLPTGLTYNAATSVIPTNTTYTAGTGIWDLSSLTIKKGETKILKIGATVSIAGTIITNETEVFSVNENDKDSIKNNNN